MFPPAFLQLLAGRIAAQVPAQCALCRAWPAQRLCAACRARFAMRAQARCTGCARRLPAGLVRCADCQRDAPVLQPCIAAVDYGYPWAGAIAQWKFHAQPGWAAALAPLLRDAPGAAAALQDADWLLPVPLSRERLRQRGYNQALQLAQRLGAGTRVRAQVLLRLHDTAAQSGLGRAERLHNLRGAFALEPLAAAGIAGRRVLLIDDVMTTGATLHAAALVLQAAGAAQVGALVLARTPSVHD